MKTISLNGIFNMSTNNGIKCEAKIPGSDFGALINNKIIENPLNTSSQAKFDEIVVPIQNSNAVFEREFEIEESALNFDNVVLHCEQIDTLCKCYVNDQLAFESNNCYHPVDTDIKPLVKAGKNTIKFCIDSAVNYIVEKQNEHKLPKNANGIDGAAYIRKSACHFGWDWGPCVPYKYIGNVEIKCYNKKIENIAIKQSIENGIATVTVNADNANEIKLIAPNGDEIKGENGKFTIENPELWYPRDLNLRDKQPLYTVVITNDEDVVEKKIGIRTIELNTSADEFGNNFQFKINGKRVFGKGANLIPFSAIPEFVTNDVVDYYLDLCVKSNFNMLRVWGGGEYASDYLIERCDELGILIWQDFQFACLMYPFYNNDFTQNVLREVEYNVKRLTTHPSLALWCGNNELEVMFSYLPKTMEIVKAYIEFFYHTLPDYIKDITDIPFIPSSPMGDKPFSKNSADEVGDTHMWNVWHGLKPLNYYEKRFTRFMSEFGLESLPSMKAIKTFATKDDFDLASDAFMSHQKCIGGNPKMLFYLQERFNLPKNFEDLPYLTGIVQADCVKSATEHFRRNKGRCNGSIFWQLNDVWNCPSWASVDYEGVPKALMYMATKFCAPITITLYEGKLYAHNDTIFDKKIDLDLNGKVKTIELKADSVEIVENVDIKPNEVYVVRWDDEIRIFDNYKKLPKANITAVKNGNQITLKSDVFAKNVYVECDAVADDNYFSLLPNEEKVITFDNNFDKYKIICENNIEFTGGKLKKAIKQFTYRLKPMNIANAFYYEHN